jgi:hypothetical protein
MLKVGNRMIANIKTANTILIVCAYCKKLMGRKDGEGVVGTSHGICSSCLSDVKPKKDSSDCSLEKVDVAAKAS